MRFAPLGMVVVPLLALLYTGMMLGWGGCPLDPRWMFAYPRRAAVVALAGPAANLLIAVGACVAYRAAAGAGVFVAPGNGAANAGWAAGLEHMLLVLALLNGILLLFNMIPVPPFDGANLVLLFLPPETGRAYLARLHEPNAQLFGQLIAFGVLAPHVCRWASMAVSWALFGW
jgi:Zn-dependent protease